MKRTRNSTPVIGIVGGLASGKSTVAALLEKHGARVVDADRIAHSMLERQKTKKKIREVFGPEVFDANGRVSHHKLAETVFREPAQVEKLNSILHPPILREIRTQVKRYIQEPDVPLVVIDAPLLMETGLEKELCDAVIFVDAPTRLRLQRAVQAKGMSPAQFRSREKAQMPVKEKKLNSSYIIRNIGSKEELAHQVDLLWPTLCQTLKTSATKAAS